MTIIEALRDRDLLGSLPAFRQLDSWFRWLIFLSATYGLPLATNEQEDLYCHHTGRSRYAPPAGGFKEVVAQVGRQAGKDRVASIIVDHEAILARHEDDGTDLFALAVGQDFRAAMRTQFSYMTAPFLRVPALARLVAAPPSRDTLRLTTGIILAAYPCRPASLRGVRALVVVLNEIAFMLSTEGNPVGTEMLRASRPCLAMTDGKLVVLSSPYGQEGALYDLHRQHFGQDDSPTLFWQATAPEMNPTLPADYLARMASDDPEAYRSEVLGEFRAGTSALFDPDAIAACVEPGVREVA
jgi:hypothetical protein